MFEIISPIYKTDYHSRFICVVKTSKGNIPFYLRTGHGGSSSACPAGSWAPFYGFFFNLWMVKPEDTQDESLHRFGTLENKIASEWLSKQNIDISNFVEIDLPKLNELFYIKYRILGNPADGGDCGFKVVYNPLRKNFHTTLEFEIGTVIEGPFTDFSVYVGVSEPYVKIFGVPVFLESLYIKDSQVEWLTKKEIIKYFV